MSKKEIQIYDWPVRVFHWIFALLFSITFFIAKTFEDDSKQFPFHMIMGFILAFTVLWRILWGIIGTRYARFSSFNLRPQNLLLYIKDLKGSVHKRFVGHNPASSWAAVLMMALSLGLAITGYLMVTYDKESFEDIHEVFSYLFFGIALLHIAGVVFHTLKLKDPIGFAVINGKKNWEDSTMAIKKTYFLIGLLFLGISGVFGFSLVKHYNQETQTLSIFGKNLVLGKIEK